MALVEVRPLPTNKWHGKKGKEAFAQPKAIEVLFDRETGKYATGLTEEEAAEYGKKMGVDLSDKFSPTEAHPYWSLKTSWVMLPNATVIFDTSKPSDFVKVKNLKASKLVANSMKEWEDGKFPEATHVIFDEAEEIDLKAAKVQLKQKATSIALDLSNEAKIAMVQILSEKSVRGRSQSFIDVEIDQILETKPAEFIRYIEMGKEEVTVRANVLEMLSKNILTKEGGSIYYMGELIGMDYEAAVSWFKDPNNSRMKVSILEKLNK